MDKIAWIEQVKKTVIKNGLVDAHHHMLSPQQRKARDTGLIDFIANSYLASDLATAGMNWSALKILDDHAAWQMITKFMPKCQFTSYYRVIEVAFRDLFGLQGPVWKADWKELDEKLKEASRDKSWTIEILSERMGMKHGILDCLATGTTNYFLENQYRDWYDFILNTRRDIPKDIIMSHIIQREPCPPFYTPSVKIDALLWGYLPESHDELEALYHVPVGEINSIGDYLEYVDRCLARIKEEGGVALKCAAANFRRIGYKAVSRRTADTIFDTPLDAWTRAEAIGFEDFIMYHLAKRIADFGLAFQFHTGTPFSGPVSVNDARCDLMMNLVTACPDTKFVLMHGSFPYTRELAEMAKRFVNVNIDISWLPMISQSAAIQAIAEYITMVPHNKLVWGNDAVFAEEAYGAFIIAIETAALGLADLIEKNLLNPEDALEIAMSIFGQNGYRIFGLSDMTRSQDDNP